LRIDYGKNMVATVESMIAALSEQVFETPCISFIAVALEVERLELDAG
jgi:hypothetical protein